MDSLPTDREEAVVNANRKLRIWKFAHEIASQGTTDQVTMEDVMNNIAKAYNGIHQSENFTWQPPAMRGLRDDWGDSYEEALGMMEEFDFFLDASPQAQQALLIALDNKRRREIRETFVNLVGYLRTNRHRWTIAIEEFLIHNTESMLDDPSKFDNFCEVLSSMLAQDHHQTQEQQEHQDQDQNHDHDHHQYETG